MSVRVLLRPFSRLSASSALCSPSRVPTLPSGGRSLRSFQTSSLRLQESTAGAAPSNGNGGDAKALLEQLAEKEKKVAELQDKYLRTAAEVENVRRIGREDARKATQYGVQGAYWT